jgi:hypothetical protein
MRVRRPPFRADGGEFFENFGCEVIVQLRAKRMRMHEPIAIVITL